MTRVGLTLVDAPASTDTDYSGILVTNDFGPHPFGVYLFTVAFFHGTQPNSRHAFVSSITGLGMSWQQIGSLTINSASLIDYWVIMFVGVGTPRPGPMVLDVHESLAFPVVVPDAGPAFVQNPAYALHRITNAPSDPSDMVLQMQGFSITSNGQTISLPQPVSDRRNLVVGATVQSGLPPVSGHPFEQVWLLDHGSVAKVAAARSAPWYLQSGGTNGVLLAEIGYHKVPWLRQKQRDDV